MQTVLLQVLLDQPNDTKWTNNGKPPCIASSQQLDEDLLGRFYFQSSHGAVYIRVTMLGKGSSVQISISALHGARIIIAFSFQYNYSNQQ